MAELPKHPCDLNEWQKLLIDMATGFASDKQRRPKGKESATVTAGGLTSNKARAEKLSPEERLALARKAVQARWNRALRQNRRPSST
jgi:hypothetical protein